MALILRPTRSDVALVALVIGLGWFLWSSVCHGGWNSRRAVAKEGMTNAMGIAAALEEDAAASGSYRADGQADGCPASMRYAGHDRPVGALSVALQGDYFAYTVSTADLDEDGRCEWFQVSARGALRPALDLVLEVDSLGRHTGAWRGLREAARSNERPSRGSTLPGGRRRGAP